MAVVNGIDEGVVNGLKNKGQWDEASKSFSEGKVYIVDARLEDPSLRNIVVEWAWPYTDKNPSNYSNIKYHVWVRYHVPQFRDSKEYITQPVEIKPKDGEPELIYGTNTFTFEATRKDADYAQVAVLVHNGNYDDAWDSFVNFWNFFSGSVGYPNSDIWNKAHALESSGEDNYPFYKNNIALPNYSTGELPGTGDEELKGKLPKDLKITKVTDKELSLSVDVSDVALYFDIIRFKIYRDIDAYDGKDNYEPYGKGKSDFVEIKNADGTSEYYISKTIKDLSTRFGTKIVSCNINVEDADNSKKASYFVTCCAFRSANEKEGITEYTSNYIDKVGPGCVPPKAPENIEDATEQDMATGLYQLTLTFTPPGNTVTAYTVQYMKQDSIMNAQEAFDSNLEKHSLEYKKEGTGSKYTEISDSDGNKKHVIKISGIEKGSYYLRIKSGADSETTSGGISSIVANNKSIEWSKIMSFSFGGKPKPPTIYSSNTSLFIGEKLLISWIQNSETNSRIALSKLYLYTSDPYVVKTGDTWDTLSGNDSSIKNKLINLNDNYKNKDGVVADLKNGDIVYLNGYLFEINDTSITNFEYVGYVPSTDPSILEVKEYGAGDAQRLVYFNTNLLNDGVNLFYRVKTSVLNKKYNPNGEDTLEYVWSDFSDIINTKVYGNIILNLYNKSNLEGGSIDVWNNNVTGYPLYIKMSPGKSSTQKPIGFNLKVIVSSGQYTSLDNYGEEYKISEGSVIYSNYFNFDDYKNNQNEKIVYINNENETSLTVRLDAFDILLNTGVEYKVSCSCTMSSGLDVSKEEALSYNGQTYKLNHSPSLIAPTLNRDNYSITLYIREATMLNTGQLVNYEPEENEKIYISVYRIENDGTFTEIESGMEYTYNMVNIVTDYHPSLNTAKYRLISKTTKYPSISISDTASYNIGEKSIIIQWNEDWSNANSFKELNSRLDLANNSINTGPFIKIPYNIDISSTYAPDVSLIEYIGRNHPVSYYGTQKGESVSVSCEIPKDDTETIYKLRRLAKYMGDAYFREPSGLGYWANIKVSFSQNHCELTVPVTLEITRVEGGK